MIMKLKKEIFLYFELIECTCLKAACGQYGSFIFIHIIPFTIQINISHVECLQIEQK